MADEIKLADLNNLEDTNSLRILLHRVKRHPAFGLEKAAEQVTNFLPNALRLATYKFRHLPTTVIVGAMKVGHDATVRVYGHASAVLRSGEQGSRLLLEAFSATGRVVSVAVPALVSCAVEAGARDGGFAFVFMYAQCAAEDEASVAEGPHHRGVPRSGVAGIFALSASQDAPLRVAEFCGVRGRGDSCESIPAGARPRLAARCGADVGYVARGYYALQLELLLKLFPRNKVLCWIATVYSKTPVPPASACFNFMGLDSFDVQPTKIYNRGYYKEKIDPRVADLLREHYRPYDAMLAELIGQDFSWMKPTDSDGPLLPSELRAHFA